MTLTAIKDVVWIVSAVGTPALALVLFALRRSFARVEDMNRLAGEVANLRTIVEAVPSKDDFHELSLSVERMRGEMRELSAVTRGLAHQTETINRFLLEFRDG